MESVTLDINRVMEIITEANKLRELLSKALNMYGHRKSSKCLAGDCTCWKCEARVVLDRKEG